MSLAMKRHLTQRMLLFFEEGISPLIRDVAVGAKGIALFNSQILAVGVGLKLR